MDVQWTAEHQAFRAEARDWLVTNLAEHNLDRPGLGEDTEPLLAWEHALVDAGYNALGWPTRFGGGGRDPLTAAVFSEEYHRVGGPRRLNFPALGLLGPTLMAVGTPQQQDRFLPRMLTCEDVWCQGFSEPSAGSDLASLTTRARLEGHHYRVSGHKTWTTNAHRANWMFALVRTGAAGTRHAGITYLLIDLHSPGVEVRPIRQISGPALFSEVFLTDVEVPVENRVGDENGGWRVANTTLVVERDASRYPAVYFQRILNEVKDLARATGHADDPVTSIRIAKLQGQIRRYEVNSYANTTSGRPSVAAVGSMSKLVRSTLQMEIFELGMSLLGDLLELGPDVLPAGVGRDWHERYWHSRASMIYAGTNEIQRNIIAERLLGLPREKRE